MTFCTPSVSEVPVVAAEGDLDPSAISTLQRRLGPALAVGRGFAVVDLRATVVAQPRAASLLCDALGRVARQGGRVALAGAPVCAGQPLDVSVIDGVEAYPTLGAALAARARGASPPCSAAPDPGAVHRRSSAKTERTRQHA